MIGPLHQADPIPGKILIRAEVGEVRDASQAVSIEVVDRNASRILVDQDKRGAGDGRGVRDFEPLGDRPG